MGILYILTGGLFLIGWFIDTIVILCKSDPYYVQEEKMEEQKFCKFCGEKIDKNSIVCPKCGRQLKKIEEKKVEVKEETKEEVSDPKFYKQIWFMCLILIIFPLVKESCEFDIPLFKITQCFSSWKARNGIIVKRALFSFN